MIMHRHATWRLMCAAVLTTTFGSASLAAAAPEAAEIVFHNFYFQPFNIEGFSTPSPIHAVHVDDSGAIWMGTESALILYNGHEIRQFQANPDEPGSLSNSFVRAFVDDPSRNILWLGTWGGGLNRFDRSTGTITPISLPRSDNAVAAFDNKIWSLAMDHDQRIWIGSFTNGLFLYDPSLNEFTQIDPGPEAGSHFANRVQALHIDAENRVWFSMLQGQLQVIDADDNTKVPLGRTVTEKVTSIVESPGGRIAVIGDDTVHVFERDGSFATSIQPPTKSSFWHLRDAVFLDESTLLIGTVDRGFWWARIGGDPVHITSGAHPGMFSSQILWDMQLDGDGNLFVADASGLWIRLRSSEAFWSGYKAVSEGGDFFMETRSVLATDNHLYFNSQNRLYQVNWPGLDQPETLSGKSFDLGTCLHPVSAAQTNEFDLWLCCEEGLFHLDLENGSLAKSTDYTVTSLIYDEKRNNLFAATIDRGLIVVDVNSHADFGNIPLAAVMDTKDRVASLALGHHEDLWIGGFSGLKRLDLKTLQPLPIASSSVNALPKRLVSFSIPTAENRLMIGTDNGVMDARLGENGKIEEITEVFATGSLSRKPFGVGHLGSEGHVFFVGEDGLFRFDTETNQTRIFSGEEGFPSMKPYIAGSSSGPNDFFLMSGVSGPLLFKPESIPFEAHVWPLRVTDINSVRENELKHWTSSKPIFQHEDKLIRIRFGLLDYSNTSNNQYRYRLSGFSDEWIDLGNLDEISLTNLDPNTYTLELEAIDGLPVRTTRTSFEFTVLPPWWQTWWAYALYAFIVIGSLAWYWWSLQRKLEREREVTQRLREADRIKSHFLNELEVKVEDATRDLRHAVEALEIKNVELDAAQQRALDASRLKSEFLANMSHEIRTPMNGILGFTQLLTKSALDHDQHDYVETIETSAKSLLGIINDVLDVSKIEAGKLIVDNAGFDPRQCLSDTLEALAPVAYEKNLELLGHVDAALPDGLRGDPARLRQMITNLIGNAIKFTEIGHVLVHATQQDDAEGSWLRIRVEDTGRGIAAADRERLFQAFERGNVNLAGRYTGTGLGLVITKKLCEAMGGRIELDSLPGQGTTVTLDLPLVADRNPENRHGAGKPLTGRRLLLIDAYEPSRDTLRARLEFWGAQVDALADPGIAPDDAFDLAIIGIERTGIDDAQNLKTLCARLPADLPRACLVATVDREILRELDASCGALCLPKIGHLEGQLRRIMGLLGMHRQEPVAEQSTPTARLNGLHVAIADDNRINRWFLKKMLELHGARVTEADSGATMLKLLHESKNGNPVDIVLLDVHMPDMDGLEVARRIRAGGDARLPLLAVSANVQPETYEAALAAGINDYLLKPVEESKLVEAVLEWTGREETV